MAAQFLNPFQGTSSKILSWFFRDWNVGGALCPDGMPAPSAVGA
jgi:hypothetical protein